MKKNLIQLGSLLVIIVALVFLSANIAKDKEAEEFRNQGFIGSVTLSIEYKDGVSDNFTDVSIKENWTIWDALDSVSKTETIGVDTKDYGDMGIFVESINGIGNDVSDGKWWQFWINGEYAQAGVSQVAISDGDAIEFIYTDNKYEE